jgi:hypothetical protein
VEHGGILLEIDAEHDGAAGARCKFPIVEPGKYTTARASLSLAGSGSSIAKSAASGVMRSHR